MKLLSPRDLIQRALGRVGLRIARIAEDVEPAMPFPILPLLVADLVGQKGTDFYFLRVGTSDRGVGDELDSLIQQHGLHGCLVKLPDEQPDSWRGRDDGQSHLACQHADFANGGEFARLLGCLQNPIVDLLSVRARGDDDQIVDAALSDGLRPTIIHYEWSELPLKRRAELKRRLLDEGYRYLDIGADTICLRVEDCR